MKRIILLFIFLLINQITFANNPALLPEDPSFTKARHEMVEKQLKPRGIKNPAVLAAMYKVQRQEFTPEKYKDRAYADTPIPLAKLSNMSQPYMVALMAEAIRPTPDQKVLEIGTAAGHSAALLAEIVGEVYTIEIVEDLAKKAHENLKRLGYTNVHTRAGDGFFGWPEASPFDAIVINCAADKVPPKLVDQLKDGGRIVMPLGDVYSPQTMVVITKTNGKLVSRPLVDVKLFPMVGEILK